MSQNASEVRGAAMHKATGGIRAGDSDGKAVTKRYAFGSMVDGSAVRTGVLSRHRTRGMLGALAGTGCSRSCGSSWFVERAPRAISLMLADGWPRLPS